MPRKLEKALSPRRVQTAGPGLHCDGGGLYLQVSEAKDGKSLNRSWVFRYWANGKLRDMGLGPLGTIGLAGAREKARAMRAKRLEGIDPIEERRAARAIPASEFITFDQAAAAYITTNEETWKNPAHRAQWRSTVSTYASPVIGALPVRDVDTSHVTTILDPLWKEKPETGSRVRGRIEAVLDWAKVRGHRSGENPARWRGHLDHIYPSLGKAKKSKRARTGRGDHHPALPYPRLRHSSRRCARAVAPLRGPSNLPF